MIKVIITNDIHSHISESISLFNWMYVEKQKGAIIIDIGDFIEGSYFHKLYNGNPEKKLLKELYTYCIPGNHGFLTTVGLFNQNVICCNVFGSESKIDFIPFVYVNVGEIKVCFIGIISPSAFRTIPKNESHNFIVKNPYPIIATIIKNESQKATHFVLLSHSGLDYDYELAKYFPVHYIISSHCHSDSTLRIINKTINIKAKDYGKSCIVMNITSKKISAFVKKTQFYGKNHMPFNVLGLQNLMIDYYFKADVPAFLLDERKFISLKSRQHFLSTLAKMIVTKMNFDGFLIDEHFMRDNLRSPKITISEFYMLFPFSDNLVSFETTKEVFNQIVARLPEIDVLNVGTEKEKDYNSKAAIIGTSNYVYENYLTEFGVGPKKIFLELREIFKNLLQNDIDIF